MSRTKTAVASATYSLSEPYNRKETYQKTLNVNSVFQKDKLASTERIAEGHLNGPFLRVSSFYKWADRIKYKNTTGQSNPKISSMTSFDSEALISYLERIEKSPVTIDDLNVGAYDFYYDVVDEIRKKHPNKINQGWNIEYERDNKRYKVTFVDDNTVMYVTVNEKSYINDYIQVVYSTVKTPSSLPEDYIKTYETTSPPDIKGMEAEETINDVSYTLNEFLYQIDDEGDVELIESNTRVKEKRERFMICFKSLVHESNELITKDIEIQIYETHRKVIEKIDLEDGYILREKLQRVFSVREEVNFKSRSKVQSKKVFIYEENSGNTELDKLFPKKASFNDVFPIIPIRLHSKNLSPSYYKEVYDLNKTGYKKLTSGNYDELIKNINDNESIDDIDFSQLRIGVSFNTSDPLGLEYIFRFFDEFYKANPTKHKETYMERRRIAESYANEDAYFQAMSAGGVQQGYPWAPLVMQADDFEFLDASINKLYSNNIRQNSGKFRFDYNLTWGEVFQRVGVGKLKGFEVGDVRHTYSKEEILYGVDIHFYSTGSVYDRVWDFYEQDYVEQYIGENYIGSPFYYEVEKISVNRIRKQITETTWVEYEITGLLSRNVIERGVSSNENGHQALRAKEEECEIIIPMTYSYLTSLSLKNRNQLCLRLPKITFNAYETKRVKWYQSSVFRIVLNIAIAVSIAVITPGGIGLLGANSALGASMGFSGSMAAIAGAAVNSLAGMILSELIGGIIKNPMLSTVVNMAIAQGISGSGKIFDFNFNLKDTFGELMKIDNLIKITNSVAGLATSQQLNNKKGQLQLQQENINNLNKQSQEINDKMNELLKRSMFINPMDFTNSTYSSYESSEEFLTRTKMVGSELIQASLNMIYHHADINLDLTLK